MTLNGILLHLPAFNAVLTSRRLLSAAGAPTGTQAQLTLPSPGTAGGSAGGGAPGADMAMQSCAQYPGAGPAGIVAVMENICEAPGASASAAVHENGTAPGAGAHAAGGAITIGAGSAPPAPMNMLSFRATSP